MGVLDKFLNVMRLNPDDEEDFFNEDYDYDDEEEIEASKSAKSSFKSKKEKDTDFEDNYKEKPVKTTPKVTPIRQSRKSSSGNMEVCVIKPTSVEDAREITETLLNGRTVVLNVEGLDVEIAQRIIDFTSGSTFAIPSTIWIASKGQAFTQEPNPIHP